MKKVELLIPVGNMDALSYAVFHGADAVYLGGKKFGARAYAQNFSDEEMIRAISFCHKYEVKVYVTVNTILYNEEIEDVLNYLKFLYRNCVDAVIMQDIGLISLTKKIMPDLNIHVSTQAHNHNEEGILFFKELGCTRVVFDRESSLDEIVNIKVPIEKEVFAYGALCICYSGNCLMSSLNGGRSANRGMCVGSCRLPYNLIKDGKKVDEGFLLSTKDLNAIPKIKDLMDKGIDSLKIEGRMKSKEYVAVVTSTFRRLIDSYYEGKTPLLTEEEKVNLLKTYNRGFTEGYLFHASTISNKESSNHQGIVIGEVVGVNNKKITIRLTDAIYQEDAIRFVKNQYGMYLNTIYNDRGLFVNHANKGEIISVDNKDRLMYDKLFGSKVVKTIDAELNKKLQKIEEKKLGIDFFFEARDDKPMLLKFFYKNKEVSVLGPVPEIAKKAPVTEELILKQISKLGDTCYQINNYEIKMGNNLFINIKDLNDLRRKAIEKLEESRKDVVKKDFTFKKPFILPSVAKKPLLSILVRKEEQVKIALQNNIDIIYVTNEELYKKFKTYKNIYLRLERVNKLDKEYKNERLLCTELGSIKKYGKENTIRSDYFLNIANDYSLHILKNMFCKSVTLSVELSQNELNNIHNKKDCELIVYGTLEAMIIKNDILHANSSTYIENDAKLKYKVMYENGYTHIMNTKIRNELEHLKRYKEFGVWRIDLLEEDSVTIQNIINLIKKSMV